MIQIHQIKRYINLEWLGWMAAIGIFSSIFYGIEKGIYWTMMLSLISVYSFHMYDLVEKLIAALVNKSQFKIERYGISLIAISSLLLFCLSPDSSSLLFALVGILVLIFIIHLLGRFMD